jgi:salicylate hydroxylase
LGIALRRFGFDVEICEQAAELVEAGAGLSLSQAVLSVFRWLDLDAEIARASAITAGMAFLHYRSGALLAGRMDLGEGSGDPQAPLAARQIHRADLQQLLVAAYLRRGGILRLGRRLVAFERASSGLTAHFSDGSVTEGDLLIGADGLKSRVRSLLWGEQAARFTGQVAYRFLVPIELGRPFLQFGRSAVFQGPGCVFNRYTIRQGRLINCVGIVATDDWQDEGWSIAAAREEVLAFYQGWHSDVTGLIGLGNQMIKWGLFDRPPLPRWSLDRVTLLGDAAHPMLPFLGLGAAMAIEDAMILARSLRRESAPAAAFARYESARLPRTRLVQQQSNHQGALVQSGDPDRFDAATAPSHDPVFYAYDPVTAEI